MEIILTIFSLLVLFFSVIIHEIAHGSVALSLGDPTAKMAGRLSLNPVKHIDPFGSIILPLLLFVATAGQGPIFGWAKPVPVNPYNFRDKKWGNLKVSLAGPGTNLLISLFFGLILRFISIPQSLYALFSIIIIYNIILAIFNLIPIPPLDGSHILFSFLPDRSFYSFKMFLQQYGFFILLFLIFFGLDWIFNFSAWLYNFIVNFPLPFL